MASPGNQHCASCIGTLSFPIADSAVLFYRFFINFGTQVVFYTKFKCKIDCLDVFNTKCNVSVNRMLINVVNIIMHVFIFGAVTS